MNHVYNIWATFAS